MVYVEIQKSIPDVDEILKTALDAVWVDMVYGDEAKDYVFEIDGYQVDGEELLKIAKSLKKIAKKRFKTKEECIKYFEEDWDFTRDQAERTCEYVMNKIEKVMETAETIKQRMGLRQLGGVRALVARELYGKDYDKLSNEEKDKICRIVRIVRENR